MVELSSQDLCDLLREARYSGFKDGKNSVVVPPHRVGGIPSSLYEKPNEYYRQNGSKLQAVKWVRDVSGLSLMEAKALVENILYRAFDGPPASLS